MKASRYLTTICLSLAFFTCLANAKSEKGKEGDRPETCPKVNKTYLERFQEAKGNAEIVKLYRETQAYYTEIGSLLDEYENASPKDKRKLEKSIRSLRSKAKKSKRNLERLLKPRLKPVEKQYYANKSKFDSYTEKGKKLAEQGAEKKALKQHQNAAKYSGAMQGAKRQMDLLNYHRFFTGEDRLEKLDF